MASLNVNEIRVDLLSGQLMLQVEQSQYPLPELLDFAVRRNPKRGFLFVSRVLGKHIPIPPARAEATYQALAEQLTAINLTQPHFIGLAETATALGQGVAEAWCRHTGKAATYQHTTRYATDHAPLLRFDEPHSHAPAHLLYDPGTEARAARELVLIDDELSTGTTLQNLAGEWLELHPRVRRVVLVSLTDWCGRREQLAEAIGVETEFVSLLRGAFQFIPSTDWQPPILPAVTGNGENKTALLPAHSPRFGQRITGEWPDFMHLPLPTGRVLVLGTGEFQFPAFQWARDLAKRGTDASWSATTRSPVLPGLAIKYSLTFSDNVGDGIPNYVYNVDANSYDQIFVTYEGECQPDPALMRQLGPKATAVKLA